MAEASFDPVAIYGSGASHPLTALAAPHRYVQGAGALERLGGLLSLVGSRRPGILLTEGARGRHGALLAASLDREGMEWRTVTFGGECSRREVERTARAMEEGGPVDVVVAVGGGKTLDAGKCVAAGLGIAVVSCPTIASTDAPCSAVAVLYGDDGAFEEVEHFRDHPALVLVDTAVIARAPVRFLVAGMGDALSTRYEARTCAGNPEARTPLGARMTVAGLTLARAAAEIVLEAGVEAASDVRQGRVTGAVERVVEANTLLSGMGFEGGGIAAAHALATGGLAALQPADGFLHGEKVAFGLLTQLALEEAGEDAAEVAGFLVSVGLPAHLGQLGIERSDHTLLEEAARIASDAPVMANEPFGVTPPAVVEAMLRADEIGREAVAERGDAAYRALHGGGG